MTLTSIENEFLTALHKIDDDYDFLLGMLHFADTDRLKLEIISGITNGTLKTTDDIIKFTER